MSSVLSTLINHAVFKQLGLYFKMFLCELYYNILVSQNSINYRSRRETCLKVNYLCEQCRIVNMFTENMFRWKMFTLIHEASAQLNMFLC